MGCGGTQCILSLSCIFKFWVALSFMFLPHRWQSTIVQTLRINSVTTLTLSQLLQAWGFFGWLKWFCFLQEKNDLYPKLNSSAWVDMLCMYFVTIFVMYRHPPLSDCLFLTVLLVQHILFIPGNHSILCYFNLSLLVLYLNCPFPYCFHFSLQLFSLICQMRGGHQAL